MRQDLSHNTFGLILKIGINIKLVKLILVFEEIEDGHHVTGAQYLQENIAPQI